MSGTACTRACGYCGRCTSAWERETEPETPAPVPARDYFGLAQRAAHTYRDRVLRGERVVPVLPEEPPF